MFKFLRRFLKEEVDEMSLLQEQFAHFRRLLTGNNQALEIMADMEEKLSGEFLFDTGYLKTQTVRLLGSVWGAVTELDLMLGGDRHPELTSVYRRLAEEIRLELAAVPSIPETPYVLPLSALNRELAPAVGGKMANLGEIGNRIGLPVPEGFAITATAYLALAGLLYRPRGHQADRQSTEEHGQYQHWATHNLGSFDDRLHMLRPGEALSHQE